MHLETRGGQGSHLDLNVLSRIHLSMKINEPPPKKTESDHVFGYGESNPELPRERRQC
jgi:hypothetical protein